MTRTADLGPGAMGARPGSLLFRSARVVGPSVGASVAVLALVSFCAALVAARFAGFGGPWLWNFDMPLINYPFAEFFRQALVGRSLPLWQDSMGMGLPLYAEGQLGAFYPPHWLIYQLPPLIALDVSRVLHLTLAGVGAGLITLRLSGSRTGALATAVIVVLCGGIAGKLQATEMVVAYGWLPWVLLPLLWRRSGPGGRGIAVAGAAWGIQALAGHPQTWVLTGISAGLTIVAMMPSWRSLFRLLAFGAMGVAVGAVQLIPTAIFTSLSTRSGGLSATNLFEFSATPFDFLGLAFANAFAPTGSPFWDVYKSWYPGGIWAALEVYSFIGLGPLALAVVGLRVRRARPLVVIAAAMILIPIIGVFQPAVWAAIPGLNGLRHPIRSYMFLDVALAVAAGVGLARLGYVRGMRLPVVIVGLVIVGYEAMLAFVWLAPDTFERLVAGWWSYIPGGGVVQIRQEAQAALWATWPLWLEVPIAILILLLMQTRRRAQLAKVLALVLIAIPLAVFGPTINRAEPFSAFSVREAVWMRSLRALRPELVSVAGSGHRYVNQLAMERIRSLDVYIPLHLAATTEMQNAVRAAPDSALGRAVGVDTTLSFGAPCIGREVAFDPAFHAHICHLDGALRAPYWLPASAVVLPLGSTGSPIRPIDAQVDPERTLQSAVPATVSSWDDGHAAMDVAAPQGGYLFIDRSWWPGWEVLVDGQPVQVYRAWSGQLVSVPAGQHHIEQRFVPWDALIGGMITLLTLVSIGIGLIWTRRGAPTH